MLSITFSYIVSPSVNMNKASTKVFEPPIRHGSVQTGMGVDYEYMEIEEDNRGTES